jgi:hypothetical protein
MTSLNKKATATARTNTRENALVDYMNGGLLLKEDADKFACTEEQLASLYKSLLDVEPSMSSCTKAGGLGNHHDLDIQTVSGRKGIELKTSEKKVNPELLTWQPWEGGVEFAQGQLTSKLMGSFLGDCGTPMISAWHQKLLTEFLPVHLPEFEKPTLEDYTKVVFTIGAETKDTPAGKLIRELRTKELLREELQKLWLSFENSWFETHTPNLERFQEVLKGILDEKDYWININKNGAFLIEGYSLKRLTYVGTAKKRQGGTVFRYKMLVQKKRSGETKEVPFVLKFYWKNGGQAVQNINLLLVSDPFA